MSRVGVVGAGYVGGTTAACLAHLGHEVTCADINANLVAALKQGEAPIVEAHLPEVILEGIRAGRLDFVVGAAGAAAGADFVFLCVDTPQGDNGAADLSRVAKAVAEIAPVLEEGAIVVNKSTMPVGSTARVAEMLAEAGRPDVAVAANPEFLREGQAVEHFLNPDRIVLGVNDEETAVRLSLLYRRLQARVIVTDPASAEMTKYASNAYLATRISFVNSIANLCEAVGADIADVALGMGYDARIGFAALSPGPGYGGSCLPKDTAALLATAHATGYDFAQLSATMAVNEAQRARTVEKVTKAAGGVLEGATLALWGLTFKAGTDDVRESPAIDIAEQMFRAGAVIRAYDPAADPDKVRARVPIEVVDDPYSACTGAAVLVVLTEWDAFRWADLARVKERMAAHAIVDARNVLDRERALALGFAYQGIGR